MSKQKRIFTIIILVFVITLSVLPFLVSVNEGMTKVVERNFLYEGVQKFIVPLEAKMIGAILIFFGYEFIFYPAASSIVVDGVTMGITWNCIGWQSFLLLGVTFLVGFGRRYTVKSTLEALAIGIFGTFWVNILRMLATIVLAVHFPPVFRIVFHNYLAAGVSFIWLVFLWWFTYKFILIEKSQVV